MTLGTLPGHNMAYHEYTLNSLGRFKFTEHRTSEQSTYIRLVEKATLNFCNIFPTFLSTYL